MGGYGILCWLPVKWRLNSLRPMTHTCVSKLTITGSDNGLAPGRCQAIIWTSAGSLSIGTLGTQFSEILSEIHTFSFKKIHLKMSSGNWRPFCLGLNVLTYTHPCLSVSQNTQANYGQYMADSRFVPSQWEIALLCNDISHWLGASLESALKYHVTQSTWMMQLLIRSTPDFHAYCLWHDGDMA